MEDLSEKQNRGKLFFFSALAVFFGSGSLWVASQAINFDGNHQVATVSGSEEVIPTAIPETKIITLMIGGDVMLDRQIRSVGEKNGYDSLFSRVAPLLSRADIAVVNLEGPITSHPSKTLLKNDKTSKLLIFTFDPITASALKEAGIDLVSLANNHTDNFGVPGFNETKEWLYSAGIGWFGNPWNTPGSEKKVCAKEICLTFIGYHEFRSGLENVLAEVKRNSDSADLLIVMPHWGDEYASAPSIRLKNKAKEFVDAGADLIVGAHPHVVLNHEMLGDVPVFYSIGNFLFDQYFSKRTMEGQLLEFTIKKEGSRTWIDSITIHTVSTASKNGVDVVGSEVI